MFFVLNDCPDLKVRAIATFCKARTIKGLLTKEVSTQNGQLESFSIDMLPEISSVRPPTHATGTIDFHFNPARYVPD
jgi:hypothetical protein